MTDQTHDWRCTLTLLLDDVTEEEARQFFGDGAEVESDGLFAFIENPGKIERQP
jgi:hypothetical protein